MKSSALLSGITTNLMTFWHNLMSKVTKTIKIKCEAKLILGYFKKLADLEVAKKKTFQLKNKDF
jgi:hypothetical protein